jgi:polyferredoxin
MPTVDSPLLKPEARVLSTLEADGSRRWLTPRLAKGRFWFRRRVVGYALIALFTLLPFTHINGKPAILLEVATRRFTLFGHTFLPTDTLLLALFMVSLILSVFAFTAIFGRVWCGWACPQTVYLELVYRPVERLFTGRASQGGKPRDDVPAWRTAAMYAVFLLLSFYLANTFLAYFVGVEKLKLWVLQSPLQHFTSFTIVLVVTGLMMFDFAYWREQMCIVGCPYGRFQSVLLDRNSLIVSYDTKRGEPRGRGARGKGRGASAPAAPEPASVALRVLPSDKSSLAPEPSPLAPAPGDCVDCSMCVQVCPTGIDIRDGLQLECVNCTQCIDACDAVMAKVNKPRGLIRYSSQNAIAGQAFRILRPRVVLYSVLIVGLVTLLTTLILTAAPVDMTVLRNAGRPFVMAADGQVENALHIKLTNRTEQPRTYTLSVVGRDDVKVLSDAKLSLAAGEMRTEPMRLVAPVESFKNGSLDLTIRATADDGVVADRIYRLLGPFGKPASN